MVITENATHIILIILIDGWKREDTKGEEGKYFKKIETKLQLQIEQHKPQFNLNNLGKVGSLANIDTRLVIYLY